MERGMPQLNNYGPGKLTLDSIRKAGEELKNSVALKYGVNPNDIFKDNEGIWRSLKDLTYRSLEEITKEKQN